MSRPDAKARKRIVRLGMILAGLAMAPASSAQAERYPPNSILLFVASWCAPCHAELARLPAITRGARPYAVLVVAYDDSAGTRAMVRGVPPAQHWRPGAELRRRMTRELLAETAGLPFSVAIDGEGRVCGSARKGLDGATAQALVAGCPR